MKFILPTIFRPVSNRYTDYPQRRINLYYLYLCLFMSIFLSACANQKPDNQDTLTQNNTAVILNQTDIEKTPAQPALSRQIQAECLNHDAIVIPPVDADDKLPETSHPATSEIDKNNPVESTANDQRTPVTQNDNIWPRIRAGFELPDDITHPALKSEIAWFSRHDNYLGRVMKRADPFLYYITQETEKRGLPTELVLLPIVESAYQPFAYSQGRAAGIWQFIPSTGRLYGLKQNWWYDGRRDIHASTQAALNYLSNLNKIFKGDWLLALAAYNSGSGTVKRAIRRNKRLHRPTDFWHLKLPDETRAYVPKLLALKAIIEQPEKYHIRLRYIANAPGFVQVKTHAQIDLALAAKLADIKLNDLYRYNPAFNRWATDPDGPYTFILPAQAAKTFKQNYASLPADKHLKWIRHKIKSGESLSVLAVKYETSVRHLRKVNHLHRKYIRAGKYLLIPVASRHRSDYALSARERLRTLQSSGHRHAQRIKHTVKSNESFWTIARKFHVNMHQLARWNGMSTHDILKPGHTLVIWLNKHGRHHTKHKLSSRPVLSTQSRYSKPMYIRSISYTVKSGDSLSRIASRYNVRIKDLHRWNRLKGKYLQPGQRLKVYIDVSRQSS